MQPSKSRRDFGHLVSDGEQRRRDEDGDYVSRPISGPLIREQPLDKCPRISYMRILAHVKDMARRHTGAIRSEGGARGRICSSLPGGLGISLPAL